MSNPKDFDFDEVLEQRQKDEAWINEFFPIMPPEFAPGWKSLCKAHGKPISVGSLNKGLSVADAHKVLLEDETGQYDALKHTISVMCGSDFNELALESISKRLRKYQFDHEGDYILNRTRGRNPLLYVTHEEPPPSVQWEAE